jgi:hypothetical protein
MPNTRREVVSYQQFRTQPVLADGLLPVARPGGELFERASAALFNFADAMGRRADQAAIADATKRTREAAVSGGPHATLDDPLGGHGAPRGGRFSADVNAAIQRAASEEGVDAGVLSQIAQIESGGNPRAKNPTSSAGGLFQQTDSNARDYGVADRFDAYQSAKGAARFLKANTAYLRKVLGRAPTAGELYLAHQQGPGGAAKLLANPNAKASSLVGADAVRLNGGSPGMSAGEFANLWTRRVSGGYVLPSDPSQFDVSKSLKISGGTWRPMQGDTLYARAWNEEGTKVYLSELDNEMRSTASQLFDQYKDDPAGLEKGMAQLKGQLAKDHVFPEIMADYSIGFDRLASRYVGQARENQRRNAEAQDRATFIAGTSQLETEQQKQIAEFDPSSDNAADAVASSQAAIDAHYDDAVRRHILDPDKAEIAKQRSRREAALGFYGKQAEALDAAGVASLHGKMREDFAAGKLAGLDGDGWAVLDKSLTALETKKRMAAARIEKTFRTTGDAFAKRIADGAEINSGELAAYALAAGSTPDGKEALQETYAKISVAREIRDFTLPQAARHVAGLRKQYGDDMTAAQARTLAFAEKTLDAKRKAISQDSVSYAEAQGLAQPTPLLTEAEGPDEIASIVAERVQAAPDVSEHLGVAPRYLKKGEAAAIAKIVQADPEKGAAIAGALVGGAGPAAPQLLAEFGNDAPMIAEAGSIVFSGGSSLAAEDVIAGYGKIDGKKPTGLKPAAAINSFDDTVGSALALQPRDRQHIAAAAASIARARIARQGVDPTSAEAQEIHTRAVQEAAGAVFDRGRQYGGFADVGGGWFSSGSRVLVPSDIAADQFGEVLASITDADLAGLAVKPKAGYDLGGFWRGQTEQQGLAATIQGATPVAVAGGYAFAKGDPSGDDPQFVQGDDGKIFILDIEALRPQLQARVPGAWR